MISADGRYVAFSSNATNLVTGDTNASERHLSPRPRDGDDAYGSASRTAAPNRSTIRRAPSLSADGQVVAFASSAADLVTGDTNGDADVFVRDLAAGTTTRVSVGPGGAQANDNSFSPTISGDGRFVAFGSVATNLVPNGGPGIYVHDRQPVSTSALAHRASTASRHRPSSASAATDATSAACTSRAFCRAKCS